MKIQLLEVKAEEGTGGVSLPADYISGNGDPYLVGLALKLPTEKNTVVNRK